MQQYTIYYDSNHHKFAVLIANAKPDLNYKRLKLTLPVFYNILKYYFAYDYLLKDINMPNPHPLVKSAIQDFKAYYTDSGPNIDNSKMIADGLKFSLNYINRHPELTKVKSITLINMHDNSILKIKNSGTVETSNELDIKLLTRALKIAIQK